MLKNDGNSKRGKKLNDDIFSDGVWGRKWRKLEKRRKLSFPIKTMKHGGVPGPLV
jgi:hypothetical protein